MNWARRVRKAREERGLSRQNLAKLSRVAERTLYNLENAKKKPHGSTLRKILDALKRVPKLPDI